MKKSIISILLVITMMVTLAACSGKADIEVAVAEPTPQTEELSLDIADPEPEAEPELELSSLTEYDLLPFLDMSDIIVLQRQEAELAPVGAEAEPIVGGWSLAEDHTITDELAAVYSTAMATADVAFEPIAYIGSQVVAGLNHCYMADADGSYVLVYIYEDLDGNAEVTGTVDLGTTDVTPEDITAADIVDLLDAGNEGDDPMGYLSTIKVYDTDVIIGGAFEDGAVDVTRVGDYDLVFYITIDRDAYDAALSAAIEALEVAAEEEYAAENDDEPAEIEDGDEAVEAVDETVDEGSEETVTAPSEEHVVGQTQVIEIVKTVRVVEGDEYDALIEAGEAEEVVPGTAVVVMTEEERIAKVMEDSGITHTEVTTDEDGNTVKTVTNVNGTVTTTTTDTDGNVISQTTEQTTPTGGNTGNTGSGNSNNGNSGNSGATPSDVISDMRDKTDTESGGKEITPVATPAPTPVPTATPKPTETEKPSTGGGTETTKPTTPTAAPAPTATPKPTATETPKPTATPKPTTAPTPTPADTWVGPTEADFIRYAQAGTRFFTWNGRECYVPWDIWQQYKPTTTGGGGTTTTPAPTTHTHSWTKHDATGHYETRQTGTTSVPKTRTVDNSYWVSNWVDGYYECFACGAHAPSVEGIVEHGIEAGHNGYHLVPAHDEGYWVEQYDTETYYVDEPVYEDVWVEDSAAYWTCSCGETRYSQP